MLKYIPSNIYTPWGWSKDLTETIWPDAKPYVSNKQIDRYLEKIQQDIHYQCVIFAEFSKKLLIIDCCDASDWEVLIEQDHVYLKLQYNPKYLYKNNVMPFIYLPSNPNFFFNNYIRLYKEYILHNHDLLTYGRWIAVSLERYNLAKNMRLLNIKTGGEYCLVPKGSGYDDHEALGLLDPYKPRERIPFNDYCSWINRAHSVLDCRGFGEFTHRMIECFGMGVPLIRPSMNNQTADPLIAGVHYLDCGENGKNLETCLNLLMNNNIRQSIIENAYDWYIRNIIPTSIKTKIYDIMEML